MHPTAVKSDIAKHKSKYKEDKETRKHKHKEHNKERDRSKHSSKKATVPPTDSSQSYDSAQHLANKLTAKLMVLLPPEDTYTRVEVLKSFKTDLTNIF